MNYEIPVRDTSIEFTAVLDKFVQHSCPTCECGMKTNALNVKRGVDFAQFLYSHCTGAFLDGIVEGLRARGYNRLETRQ
jgi:hypothetical protein